jgi:prepilin-type N-terminal cleavage/methylation domain-containing protein
MKQKGFTLIELLVVVAIIGILAAIGVNTFSGYQGKAKVSTTRSNFSMIYKTWLYEKAKCEVDTSERAFWDKTTCQVAVANNSSDFLRVSGIISNYYGLNNKYRIGQPTKNLFHQYERNLYNMDCSTDETNDSNIGFLRSCYDQSNSRISFKGCFKSPCSVVGNRFLKYIDY